MKIVSRNDNLLIIKDFGVVSYLLGFIFLVVGGVIFFSQSFGNSFVNKLEVGAFVAFGLYIIVSNESSTISVDKVAENIVIKRARLFSADNEIYNFQDLDKVIVQEDRHSSGKGGNTVVYKIKLVLKNGTRVDFKNNPGTVSPIFAQKKKRVQIAKDVAEFVGVPFEEFDAPSIGEVFNIFKKAVDLAATGKIKNISDLPINDFKINSL